MRTKDYIVWKVELLYKRWSLWIESIANTVDKD